METGYAYYLKRIDKQLKESMNLVLEPYDITKSQIDILYFLQKHPNERIIQKDIENFYHISNPTVTGLLNRLESKGLIIRESSIDDKRTKTIKQTEKAVELHKKVQSKILSNEEKIVQGFSQEEKELLHHLLKKMLNNLSEKED